MQEPAHNLATGTVIDGRYQILHEIGRGGMSTVYLAEHTLIGRRVAIKVLHAEVARSAESVARFMAEARTVGTLGHPNVVASTDMGHLLDGRPYLILELLEGLTLTEELSRTGVLPFPRAAHIAMQIASAAYAAHSRGIVHRDLKSDNVFLVHTADGVDHVKILDFGISKFLEAPPESGQTQRGVILGTPEFMAPEQIHSPEEVDHRADIYALGTILHHMLTGQTPFAHTPPAKLWNRIINEPPLPIINASVPPILSGIIQWTLSKAPGDRPQSMVELHDQLAAFAPSSYSTPMPARMTSSPRITGSGPLPVRLASSPRITGSGPLPARVPTPLRDPRSAQRARSQQEPTQRTSRQIVVSRGIWALLVMLLPLAGGIVTALLWILPALRGAPPPATPPAATPASVTAPAGPQAAVDPPEPAVSPSPPAAGTASIAQAQPAAAAPDAPGTAHVDDAGEPEPPQQRGRRERRTGSSRPAAVGRGKDAPRGDTGRAVAPPAGSEATAKPRIVTPPATPEVGRVDTEATKQVVRAHLGDIRTCHERGRMDSPGLAGRVVVRITIGKGGRVTSTTVASSTLGAPLVEKCITQMVEKWTFPAPTGGSTAVIAYPFVLK
jgi:serine/threonine-protein kinase